ncbi:MAG TPA: glycosyltransferase family 1 protein [Thermoanaerobaculia bacterium]|nr:glycosyltransferase family 1 protein [Thermoanaerobaculia bacterium]
MILPTIGTVVHTLGHALANRTKRAVRAAATRERKLRIGVDIRPFYEPLTGVGWYLYHLLHELARHQDVEIFLFGDARMTDEGPHLHADLPPNAQLCMFDLRGEPKSNLARPLTAAAYVAWIALTDCDVIFGANYFLPRLMGAVARRRVMTVHDLTYKRYPELLQKETLENLERQMAREVALADAIICVSESTRDDLLHFYEVDSRRVYAIHSGIAPLPQAAPIPGLPRRYILFVSTIEPRKNVGVLLDAFARIRDEYEGSLVIAGKIGWKSEEIAERLREPRVVHLDYLPPPELATAYANADLFVFPSIYEGFGFPMLEAMQQGVPVIAARSSSLPEVGGDAALYFDPRDAEELASQIRRVLREGMLWQGLIARGRERAAMFRWDLTAELTLEVLRSVV